MGEMNSMKSDAKTQKRDGGKDDEGDPCDGDGGW
jgi:hypothetical protein